MAEMHSWHRGRLLDHIQLVVRDLEAAHHFHGAAFAVLGVPVVDGEGYYYADALFVSTGEPLTGRALIAFQAPDRRTVARFHEAALAAGGTDNGGPGLRPYHADDYAAFVLDPDGNTIEAVYHGPAERSAPSVEIRAVT